MRRAVGDADGRWRADVDELRLEVAVVVEHLDAVVGAVADVDQPLGVHRECVRDVELPRRRAGDPHDLRKRPFLSNLAMRELP